MDEVRVGPGSSRRGERRWPPSLVVVVLAAMPLLLPLPRVSVVWWAVPAAGLALLGAIVVGDPGRIDRAEPRLRRLGIALTLVLAGLATWAAVWLIAELIAGAPQLDTAGALLAYGFLVWIDTNLTFALLFWELDGGGSAERFTNPRRYPDLAFPQHMNPEVAPPGWMPEFLDYLYLGLTNSLAFSPTDVMPLARWAKLLMALQSLVSVGILSLVIANAVNTLG
jgi:uncharacterized membrane protein